MLVKICKDGYEITVNGVKCPVIKQASKGEGKEVVKIEKVVGPSYQAYISLTKLVEGEQDFEVAPHKEVSSNRYTLTEEEQSKVDGLQAQIDAIIEVAKARFVPSVGKKKLSDYSIEELERIIEAKRQENEKLTSNN